MPRWVLRIYWRSALRSNSFFGRISLELYIREPSSITPVWGALGYGKNKEPTPPFFLEGVAALLFAPHPRAAQREILSDRKVCLMFSEVGGALPCHLPSHASHFLP